MEFYAKSNTDDLCELGMMKVFVESFYWTLLLH